METIKAGDLVVVVRPGRCCGDRGIGHLFRVLWIEQTRDVPCLACGGRHGLQGLQILAIETVDRHSMRAVGWETWRLRRIDPQTEPEEALTEGCTH